MKGILAQKIGMTQIYDDKGAVKAVTAIKAGPCRVLTRRTKEKNGYSAIQLGFGIRKLHRVSKAVKEHISKAGYTDTAPAWINEIRLDEDPQENIGDELNVSIFSNGEYVDISGKTKGQGFQGVVKRYRFKGGRASHGGDWLRRGGSIGMCEKPGKVYKGRKMPGHMGNVRRTIQNLQIAGVRAEDNVLLIHGAVPGPNGGYIEIRKSKKK